MTFPENEIHIYSIDSRNVNTDTEYFQNVLSPFELLKAKRFRFEKDKINYKIFRSALRKILSQYLNTDPSAITFSYSEKGKPYIQDSSIKFNLSHSKHMAVYAVTKEDEIGIDTEYKKKIPDALEIAERFFSKEENQEFSRISKKDIPVSFFKCWTRKEAFIKAVGEGLSYPLKDFSVTFRQEVKPEVYIIKGKEKESNEWSLFEIDIDLGFVTSLAVRSKKKNIVIKNLKM